MTACLRAAALFLSTASLCLWPQRIEPREDPAKYPASVTLPDGNRVAAEFMGHSIPVAGGVEFAQNHVVIEVALFGPAAGRKAGPVRLSSNHWTLAVNKAKVPLLSDTPAMVATSIKYPDSEGPQFTATGGINDAGVIAGAPSRRYPPGVDPRRRPPGQPRAPQPEDRSGVLKPAESLDEQIRNASLIEGETALPTAGLLFFRYPGKLTKIKSLELMYQPRPDVPAVRIVIPR